MVHAHPSKLRPPEDRPCVNAYLSKAKLPESCAKRITEHITDMVVRDLCPTTMVKGIGFQALMNYVEPGYRVPSTTHIAEVARRKFANGKATIKDYLQTEVEFFAFTIDIWTSRANDVYLSLTCHFVTSR